MKDENVELKRMDNLKIWARPEIVDVDSGMDDIEMPGVGPNMEGINSASS